jgi:pimeloyl-ACP methyl ester carboxylesterase
MPRKITLWPALGFAFVTVVSLAFLVYLSDIERAKEKVRHGSEVFQSRFGTMEYAVSGKGPAVLVVHGTGGGFDQGLAFGERIVAAGWQVVSPSRFGYLRSAFPEDSSPEAQADAFVDLLDELKIERAPVIGVSAGALSAIQFAIRHPDRCSGLVAVVPAAYAPDRPPAEPLTPAAKWIIEHSLKSDFLFWSGMSVAEDEMIGALLATDPELVKTASSAEQLRARNTLTSILPVSKRAQGLLNDARQAREPSPMKLEDIRVPTLAISLEDDRFGTLAAAKHIAASVPGARLVVFSAGGHIWIGHDEEVFAEIGQLLSEVARPRQRQQGAEKPPRSSEERRTQVLEGIIKKPA